MHPSRLNILVERYAQNKSLLSASEVTEIEAYLEGNPSARKYVERLRDFYLEVSASASGSKQQLNDFVDRIFGSKSVLRLVPFNQNVRGIENKGPIVLAAQTSRQHSPTVRPLATLVAEEQKMVLRIRENLIKNAVEFFFLTRSIESRAHAIVELPTVASTLLLDADGRGSIARDALPTELPENWSAHVHIPVGTIAVTKEHSEVLPGTGWTEKLSEGGPVQIEIAEDEWFATSQHPVDRDIRYLVVSGEAKLPKLYRRFETGIRFDTPSVGDMVRIYL